MKDRPKVVTLYSNRPAPETEEGKKAEEAFDNYILARFSGQEPESAAETPFAEAMPAPVEQEEKPLKYGTLENYLFLAILLGVVVALILGL